MMKKFLISGVSSGIGKAIAESLLRDNYQIIGLAKNPQKFIPTDKNYSSYQINFAEINSVEAKIKAIATEHDDICGIICAAGVGYFGELERFSRIKMQELMNINFLSQALLVKTLLPNLKKQAQGKIIFIGSESGLQGAKKGSIYCASKFALRGFAQSLRQECNTASIAITTVNPGMVKTPFFDELDFVHGADEANTILPEQIAKIVSLILEMPNNCVLEEINCQPLKRVVKKKIPLI